MGIWRLQIFGKAFVSPHANLNLGSSFENQSHDLGTILELDRLAWLVDEDGIYYPLVRREGLYGSSKFVFLPLRVVLGQVRLFFKRPVGLKILIITPIFLPMGLVVLTPVL